MTLFSFVLLAPNFLLFSTDDLDIYRKGGETGIVISQAGIGRYTFDFLGYVFRFMHVDYNSYLIISIALFSLSMALLYRTVARILNINISSSFFLGYLIFLTFGLNLDLYQFIFAYLQYGLVFCCAAGVIWVAYHVRDTISATIWTCVLSAVGLGAYQLFAHIVLMTTLALAVSSDLCGDVEASAAGEGSRPIRRTIGVSLLGLAIGAALYLAVNSALQHFRVAGFESYPVRKQGLLFAWSNLSAYRLTLLELIGFSDTRYSPLLPNLWQWIVIAILLYSVADLLMMRRRRRSLGIFAIIIALLCWPNPANLFLADYWPSARSMSGFGIFFGLLCGTLSWRAQSGSGFSSIGRSLAVVAGVSQCILMSVRYQDRFLQQNMDVALAQAILLHAYAEFPVDKPIGIDLAIVPDALQTAKPIVYDYGRSMFATSWSAPAFLDYLSGHRVSAQVVSPGNCASSVTRLSYAMRGDRLLACFIAR